MSILSPVARRFRLNPLQKEFERIRKGYVLLLVLPLAIQLLLFKLIKYAILTADPIGFRSYENYLGHLLVQHAPMPLLIAALATVVGVLVVFRLPALGALFLPMIVGLIGLVGYTLRFLLDVIPSWLSWEFLEIIRIDLALVITYGAIALLALKYMRGKGITISLVFLHLAAIVIGCLAAFEFGYFVETGSLADSYLLQYSITHFQNVQTIVANEMSSAKLALLLTPVIASTLPLIYRWRMRSRTKVTRYDVHKKTVPFSAPLLFSLSALIFLLPELPVDSSLEPVRNNIVVEIFQRLETPDDVVPILAELDVHAEYGIPSERVTLEAGAGQPVSKNVVIIILESTRAQSTSLYNPAISTTPFLKSLADNSLVVEDMSAVVPHTNKALVPIHCGVYPKISQDESQITPDTQCLPELLAEHGYASAFFTPATLDFENKGRLLSQMGFDESFGHGAFEVEGFDRVNYFGFEDRIALEPAFDWAFEKSSSGTPFLMSFLTVTTHHDYTVPPAHPMEEYDVRDDAYNNYLNTLAYQDGFLRDFISMFDETGLSDSTTFIIVGDHGEAFGEHGEWYHNTIMWQEGIHIPTLVKMPSGQSGKITGTRHQTDIFNAVIDVLGFDIHGGPLPGISLFDEVPEGRKLFMGGWTENQAMALRQDSTKFIYRFGRRPSEYYNLDRDPDENTNRVSTLPEDSVAALEMSIIQWRKAVADQYDK